MAISIKTFLDKETATFSHLVIDNSSKKVAVIDSVLNYDQYSGITSHKSADEIIDYIKKNGFDVEWILDTHIHADHITGSSYIKKKLGGKIAIGAHIKEVLKLWQPIFNSKDTPLDGSQFDHLFSDGDEFMLGSIKVKVMHTPGHTPACSCWLFNDDALFVGDTIFMPDLGTARTDFPGGSAEDMYDSIQKILQFPDQTRIFLCHDYPPEGREAQFMTTVKEQKEKNVLVGLGISKEKYVKIRNKRDENKPVPKLLLPSIQANLRTGEFGLAEGNGTQYVKIPVDKLKNIC